MSKRNLFLLNRDAWEEVYYALTKNMFRTLLTMIGVGWAMFLFVTLLGLVNGIRNGFDRDLKGTSTNSMFVWTQNTSIPYQGFGRGRTFNIQLDDINALKKRFKNIRHITPRNRKNGKVNYKAQYGSYMVFGDYPVINLMFKKKIKQGRFINQDDIKENRKICLLGDEIVEELYTNEEEVIGTRIDLNGTSFTVVGVYNDDKGFGGNTSIYVPYTTFQSMYNQGDKVAWLAINIKDDYNLQEAEEEIISFLKKRHKVHPNDTQAFGSFNLGFFEKLFNFIKGLEFLAASVGFLTLFSGVIAISSILLITVKERTKEFGIRRALGALPQQIIYQILLESTLITVISGASGIFMATAVLAGVNYMVGNSSDTEIPLVNCSVNIMTLVWSSFIVLIMSLLAALLPATRAISIKPIDALREE